MTVRPRIPVTRRLPEAVERRLAAHYEVTLNTDDVALSPVELALAVQEFDALVPTITDRLDADVIAHGGRARMFANYGAGLDHIDLAAAHAAGIVISNTPGALTEATAELAILLMLMVARRAGEGEREVRAGEWTGWRPTHLIGRGLTGRTLGLIGFGRIAQSTAAKARGLGLRVVYASRTPAAPETERLLAVTRMPSVEALMATADIVSLHVPGGADTHHLVDAALLAQANPGAILINTARGSVIDEAALVAALASGQIGGVGLDVYANEPVISAALLQSPHTVLLPHLGSATEEARTAMGMQAADNLDAFFAGRPLPDRVA